VIVVEVPHRHSIPLRRLGLNIRGGGFCYIDFMNTLFNKHPALWRVIAGLLLGVGVTLIGLWALALSMKSSPGGVEDSVSFVSWLLSVFLDG